jgi:hypothetical protein
MNLVARTCDDRFDVWKQSNQSARDRCRITHPMRWGFGAQTTSVPALRLAVPFIESFEVDGRVVTFIGATRSGDNCGGIYVAGAVGSEGVGTVSRRIRSPGARRRTRPAEPADRRSAAVR